MFIQENVPLQAFTTMRLGGKAAYLSEVNEHGDVAKLVAWANERQLPIIMIGEGSNVIWRDEGFNGLVLVNKLLGFETSYPDQETLYLTVGAGENWDSVVERSVKLGFNGIAELSLIPGTVGATPVQNVGAYGREISDTLVTLEAYDLKANKFINLRADDCDFGYRTSRFKTTDRSRFLITAITLMLTKDSPVPPFYDSLQRYFDDKNVVKPSVSDIRNAVVEIRSHKLPDVKTTANNGSFFGNPIISQADFVQLNADFPKIKSWNTDDGNIKLSAAWLIEQAGFADNHDLETGMATWHGQPLVLINENAKTTADLLNYKKKIVSSVESKFHVTLEQEPELLP